jgi:hypothetical protein
LWRHNLEVALNHPAIIAVLAGVIVGAAPYAHAGDGGPVIVVPGRPDVPVIIKGRDASWAVVYGDWGLKRPGADIIIQGGGRIDPQPWTRGYYPATGRAPAYGRREIEPPSGRRLMAPAPTYYRSWSAGSAPGPVTEYPPFDPPPVIVAPRRLGR